MKSLHEIPALAGSRVLRRGRLIWWLSLLMVVVVGVPIGQARVSADIDIYREKPVIWSETSLGEPRDDSSLRVHILMPRDEGRRRLYQRCSFPVSGAGPYRCGMDEQAAQDDPGWWVAKAFVDDVFIGRKRFWAE